ncbi:hypothetical protein LWI29_029974 [Acer saccharum]|uniref:Arginyl-tRNA synthetase n=1 Tax=Acer saccharum TaxID=4024 RepID=A0AA39SNA4_ACESA|nr:hypothetical protein LWI29_029974 [Acer saccharum]
MVAVVVVLINTAANKGEPMRERSNQATTAILRNLPESEMIESSSIGGPGFVNVLLSNNWIAENIQKMLVDGIETWAPRLHVRKAVVDFSSPNIAKEIHVGHLRSTVIGDCIARMLEFSNVEVLRRNHVGDWGTQFGMLIENLFDKFPSVEDFNETAIGDLKALYKESKQRFDEDPAFKARAQQAVVRLQGGEPKYRQVWMQICDISRKEFDKVYNCLGVELEEKGESFYNPYIPRVIEALTNQGLVEENEGARVIWIEGFSTPLIVVKKDGGYNYASTDLAALWYRLNEEQADWIIYVTDVGQQEHFDKVFSAAKRASWLSADNRAYPKASHVGFGLVLGEDGKRFRTRSSEVVRLVDLLDEAKSRMLKISKEKQADRKKYGGILWTDEELEKISEPVGYAAIKYADLKSNRLTNYTFSFKQMLNTEGNTAVSLLYAHARICAIIEKSEQNIQELKKGKVVQPASFEKEREYFEEVDAFELLEESPSPKRFGTWTMGNQSENVTITHLCSRLKKWQIFKKLNYNCGSSITLSKILETPSTTLKPIKREDFDASILRTPEKSSPKITTGLQSIQSRPDKNITNKDVPQRDYISLSNELLVSVKEESCEDIEVGVKDLSLASTSASLDLDHVNPFAMLLAVCDQLAPAKLLDVLSKYCDPDSIAKIGEGTYGEAFKAGNTVCKIVPIDGDIKVNGEVQKRSEELLEEVVLSLTLNHLRNEGDARNACTTFIDTLDLKVCQGPYDAVLVKAWEDWDDKHGSENDHPKQFPENQCYVVFVLQHGGKDLEGFVLLNYDEARSLLVQVTAALAVAEAAYEFEHRDLHWSCYLLFLL